MTDPLVARSLVQSPILRPGGLLSLALAALAVAVVAATGSRLLVSLVTQATIIAMLALSVGFLARTADLYSFGHAAPFGLGAYGAALVLKAEVQTELGLLAMLAGICLLFFLVGLLVSRLSGIAFSMLTLALGQFFFVAVSKFRTVTSGEDGMLVAMPRSLFGIPGRTFQTPDGMLVAASALLAAAVVAIYLFEATRTGRLAVGVRENEERVLFLGYRTKVLKAAIFAASALIAALSGVLFALYQGFVSPEIMHWSFSGNALIMAILGGSLVVWGPVAGAFVFFFLREWLLGATEHWHAVLGAILILVTVAWPGGIGGLEGLVRRRLRGVRAPGAGG